MKNANLKSEHELKERLHNGEEFDYKGNRVFYDESFVFKGGSPYRIHHSALQVYWPEFAEMTIKPTWEDDLKDGVNILCHVRKNVDSCPHQRVVINKVIGGYIDSLHEAWGFAEPITPDDELIWKGGE